MLFSSRENNDKFSENDPYLKKEKTQYLSNLITKHKAFLPWELLNEKLIVIKQKKSKNKLEKGKEKEKEVSKGKDKGKKIEEEVEKIDHLSDKIEKKSEAIVESSIESDSVDLFFQIS